MSTTATEVKDIVEDVQDLVEDTTEFVKGASWLSNPKVQLAGVALLSAGIGAATAYVVLSHRLRVKYQQLADDQIEDVKKNYSVLRKEGVDLAEMADRYPDEEKLADREVAKEIIADNGYRQYEKVEPAVVVDPADGTLRTTEVQTGVEEEVTVTQAIIEATQIRELNVFESDMPDSYFLYEEENRRREEKPMEPFVITKDEFDANETDFSQTCLTYYEGDDVVTDQDDKVVDDPNPVIGPENTMRFGHGSGDPNVVYIRNARLKIDIELVYSAGKYTMEVLGFDDGGDTLKHSDRRPKKFRPDRD